MTLEERLAELGVDLSDLPKHKRIPMLAINREIKEWKGELIDSPLDLYRFILHLTDIIDRMETRIVNLTGELDYLIKCAPDVEIECDLCAHRDHVGEPPCDKCSPPPGESFFEFAGILEDWSVDE